MSKTFRKRKAEDSFKVKRNNLKESNRKQINFDVNDIDAFEEDLQEDFQRFHEWRKKGVKKDLT